ncbi:uncharacterized protein K452DRAFT_312371 [Aplosporella prunicola CBS 121167]|uniref:DUF7730 domain-containing protein n=1 Tax=Aplosporella prunicola CBS 121167 TaxID=1176127 RepID=A0A6A6B1A0_9PEZI|nr:uncharacterized protein K452DRAFT_312371 [Aplosporella prunicola CBS 121167]KAF2137358.1 hypothetical protein K452DRAFT_312371 [Aplosporella prunicola CBS 121167]
MTLTWDPPIRRVRPPPAVDRPNRFRFLGKRITTLIGRPLGDGPTALPVPHPRPRPLTPTTEDDLGMHEQMQSPFFGRLPLDIRLRLYEVLFGKRVVHIGMEYDYPIRKGNGHGGYESRWPREKAGQRREWRWRSCVCCRGSNNLCKDKCTGECGYRDNQYCEENGVAKNPEKCRVDARWILVCRKAYYEGIAVLYETNTFTMRYAIHKTPPIAVPLGHEVPYYHRALDWYRVSTSSIPSIPDCNDYENPGCWRQLSIISLALPTNHFGSITSLEITHWGIIWPPDPGQPHELQCYENTWREMLLPRLRRLRVHLETWYYEGYGVVSPRIEAAWFSVVDDIIRSRNLHLEFMVPDSWLFALNTRNAEPLTGSRGPHDRFWRSVDSVEGAGNSSKGLGYFVVGTWDMNPNRMSNW